MNPRAAAAQVLQKVCGRGQPLEQALEHIEGQVAVADRPLLQELCYGTLRWEPRLRFFLRCLLRRPLKARDRDIEWLLLLGLYQLLYLRVPPHAAVAETVGAAAELDRGWLKGLVNAVLRNFQRRRETLLAAAAADEEAAHAHPRWLIERLRRDWPRDWAAILAANNERPPMALRVNRLRSSREDYLVQLQAAGLHARPLPHTPAGVILEQAVDVTRLPGFATGWVSVQDGAAQLAAPLLDLRPGLRVLDACAAPGGKTGHILECEPALEEVVALDLDAGRCARIRDNLRRLGLHARVLCGDATAPESWWDGRPFQRILLDAPCTATGVLRRHPDIKCRRRPAHVERIQAVQDRLLRALWPLLDGGGMLLYATCSVLPQENADRITAFLAEHADARAHVLAGPWGRVSGPGRQILPGEDEMDGFYYAALYKEGR